MNAVKSGKAMMRQERPFGIGEPDTPTAQQLLQHSVLGLEEFSNDELAAMDPSRDSHQQECERLGRGTLARSLLRTSYELLDDTP